MPTVTLTCGDLDYSDTGGSGPVAVMTHGVLMNSELWDKTAALLGPQVRCVCPTLPLGAHAHPLEPSVDLSVQGLAAILGEFLDALDLREVTLVVNAVGAPLALAADGHPRVKDLVLATCEAFTDQFPGQRGRNLRRFATIPDGLRAAVALLRAPGAAKVSATFGALSKRGVGSTLIRHWTQHALANEYIRDDLRRYILAAQPADLDAATKKLADFKGRTLLLWAADERVHQPGLADELLVLIPGSRYVPIEDSYALIPLDQPERVADELRTFLFSF